MKPLVYLVLLVVVAGGLFIGCAAMAKRMLFHPTHHHQTNGLEPWRVEGEVWGFIRHAANPEAIWLFAHGNAGQAADRVYALHAFSPRDAVYIVEYPGFGQRAGSPSKRSIDDAVRNAYQWLRKTYPDKRVCVAAESIGSGPASELAREPNPPSKFVFVVPFESLKKLAAEHVSFVPVGLILGPTWNNLHALQGYRGPIDVFGAEEDEIIPVAQAKALAKSLPQARFILLPGRHNDWSQQPLVRFESTGI